MIVKIKGNEMPTVSVDWGGTYNSCIRDATVSVLNTAPSFAVGDKLELIDKGKRLFYGIVVSRNRAGNSDEITVKADDYGVYLKRNKTSISFNNATPASIARTIAAKHGIPVGKLASPGKQITRNFYGCALADIIMTAYTLASDGKHFYCIVFDGDGKLNVLELSEAVTAQEKAYKNIVYAESIEAMVNAVEVYDEDNKKLTEYTNAGDIGKYGRFAEYYKKTKTETDAAKAAKAKLKPLEQSVRVEGMLGDTSCTTGKAIKLTSPYRAASGLFWIKTDRHKWVGEEYTMDLELSFERLMAETEVGSE